jgi:hypothetical protein
MPTRIERLPSRAEARLYSPEITPLLQSLLATLADIDFAYESDLEVVQNSATDEILKRKVIERLQQQHRERREPYIRQIKALQRRFLPMAA